MADNVQLRMKDYNPPDASSLGNVEPYGDMSNLSPTTMVLNYLKAKGYQLNTENVRRTLEESARDPSLIPGLRSQEPPPADQNTSSSRPSVANKIETRGNPPPADLSKVPNAEEFPGTSPGGSPTTSAQPSGGSLDVGNVGQAIAAGLAAGGLGAGASYLLGNRGGPTLGMNEPGVPTNVPQPSGDGGRYNVLPPPEPSPFDRAMDRAVQPATGTPLLDGPPSISGVNPVVHPSEVIGKPGLPPGITPVDAANVSMPNVGEHLPLLPPRGASGAVRPLAPRPYVPRLPIR